jgi:hypothetical protein
MNDFLTEKGYYSNSKKWKMETKAALLRYPFQIISG